MVDLTMTFTSKNAIGALKFLTALVSQEAPLSRAEIGSSSALAEFSFNDATSRTAFRQKDKHTLATDFSVSNIKYNPEK